MTLQRSVGNAAVSELMGSGRRAQPLDPASSGAFPIQRKPEEPAEERAAPGGGAATEEPERPAWDVRTSAQQALPGDPVLGVTSRPALEAALRERLRKNRSTAKAFQRAYSRGTLDVWTRFVTESMSEAFAEGDWPWYVELLSSTLQTVLTAVFPPSRALMVVLTVKGAEFGLGQVEDALEQEFEASAGGRRAEDLLRQAPTIADVISDAIDPLMALLAEGADYVDWLKEAPEDELHLFRLPPRVPEITEGTVRTVVAQLLSTRARKGATILAGQSNLVEVRAQVGAPGAVSETAPTTYRGPAALRKEIVNKTISALPHHPLRIELTSRPGVILRSMVDAGWPSLAYADHATAIEGAYPTASPTVIERQADGKIGVFGGSLVEHLHLYERLHRDQTFAGFLLPYARSMDAPSEPVSRQDPRTATGVAQDIYQRVYPDLVEAAALFIDDSVAPLTVSKGEPSQ